MDFLKLHSQMNPQSDVVPPAKYPPQNKQHGTMGGVWTGIYKKESIAFTVKTACTVFIVVGVRPWEGGGGGVIVRCSLADVNSMWRPGSAADWQTVPLQSAANQPVSNSRCYRGHNVQPAAPPVTPLRLFLPSFAASPEPDAVFSQHAKAKRAGLPV